VMPSTLVEFRHSFGGTYCPHLQGRKNYAEEATSRKQSCVYCLLGLFFDPEDGSSMFLWNIGELLSG
jgi:hypothetical protein